MFSNNNKIAESHCSMNYYISARLVEVGSRLTPDLRQTRPADVLVADWESCVGCHCSLTTHPYCAALLSGAAPAATKQRKHIGNDPKCRELGWVCSSGC